MTFWEVWATKSSSEWMPTHKLTIVWRIKQNFELNNPFLWWGSIQPTWRHYRLALAPGSCDIRVCCCLFWCSVTGNWFSSSGTGRWFRIERRQAVFLYWMQDSNLYLIWHTYMFVGVNFNAPVTGKWYQIERRQATGLDAWASRVKCLARFLSHLHEICIYLSCL